MPSRKPSNKISSSHSGKPVLKKQKCHDKNGIVQLKRDNKPKKLEIDRLQSGFGKLNISVGPEKGKQEIQNYTKPKALSAITEKLDNIGHSVVTLNADFQILNFNPTAYQTFYLLFGKRIQTGKGFKDIITQNKFKWFEEELERALGGSSVVTEKELKTPRGRVTIFILSCLPVLDKNKIVRSLTLSLLDITEFTKTRKELLKSQELINSVFQIADIGIVIVDEAGKYIKVSDSFNKLLGYENGELEGRHFILSSPGPGRKGAPDGFSQYLSGKKANREMDVFNKAGEKVRLSRTINIFTNAIGEKYLVVTVRDISETIKYRHLLQNTERIARIGGWELDIATGVVTRTDGLYQIIELEKDKINSFSLGKKLDALYTPDSRPLMEKAMNDATYKGKPFDLEVKIVTGKGKIKWVRVTCTPERSNSKTIRLIGTLHDISVQKETESELERLSLVASKTNNAVFITDEHGKTIWLNQSVEKMTGYKKKEIIGKTPGQVLQGAETDKATIARIRNHLEKYLPVSEVIKNYKKDGTPFWINMDIAPVFKNGNLVNFIGVGVEVTELVKAREAEKQKGILEQQQKLFNAIAKNFPDGIIGVLDKNFHYIFAGGTEIKKLGLTQRDLIGKNIFDHLSEKSNADALPFLDQVISGRTVSFETEMHDRIFAVNAVPLPGHNRQISQILVVLHNVTEQKKAEKGILEALAKQQELNELKSKFVSIASHEFRTPLSAILSSTYLIAKYSHSHEEDKVQKHIERIEGSVRALTDILNDFLSLGKIEDGKLRNNVSEFNIAEYCHALVEEVQINLKKGQSIVYSHIGGKEIFCLDKQHLRNVLVNLVSNASKYSGEGKRIWLTSGINDAGMQFEVKDEGIGIPLEDQPNIFQSFFRANNAGNIQGTGMGLHIVKRFLDMMDGSIRFSSELNKGSVFIIRFREPDQTKLS